MIINPEERYYLKLKAAYYYYEEDYTQDAISKMLNISRPTLSKFLKEAKEEGIVKIEIQDIRNISHLLSLEVQLKKRYNLQDVKVVDSIKNDSTEIRKQLGKTAAVYFEGLIKSGLKIGVSWGKTLEAMVGNLRDNKNIRNLEIVTLLGGPGAFEFKAHANFINEKMLSRYNGKGYFLYAPTIVENRELFNHLVQSKEIKEVLEKGKSVDIALVGIGGPIDNSTVLETGFFQEKHIEQLKESKAVGDICSRFFDINGHICNLELNDRIVGINLQDLRKIPKVIAVAGGKEKHDSILGAIRGKLIDVLITDKYTAQDILQED